MENWQSGNNYPQANNQPSDPTPPTTAYPRPSQGVPHNQHAQSNPYDDQTKIYANPHNYYEPPNHQPPPQGTQNFGGYPASGVGNNSGYNPYPQAVYGSPQGISPYLPPQQQYAGTATPNKNNGKFAVIGIGLLGTMGLVMALIVLFIIARPFGSSETSAKPTTSHVAENSNKPRPNPLPAPPRDRTVQESSVTAQQEEELRRAVKDLFPPAVGEIVELENCVESDFPLDESRKFFQCLIPSGITPGNIDSVGIVTDPEAVRILVEDYEYPEWRYIRSAEGHDFHLMQEDYDSTSQEQYITFAYDLRPNNIAVVYMIFADERTASDYFVNVGLAHYL